MTTSDLPLAPAALTHACFMPDYASARANFLAAAAAAGARTDTLVHDQVSGPDGSTLSTDVAILGPIQAEQAVLIVSSTHGPEGFTGSAAQVALLRQMAVRPQAADIRIVLVHAINPWGFAHISRTTENNIDLNRNFIDWDNPPPDNPLYSSLHAALTTQAWTPEALDAAEARLQAWIGEHGQDTFVDVLAKGQYSHPHGVHYGGTGPEWSNRTLRTIVQRHLAGARRIGFIDWHTGLGERGQPFFLCFNEPGGPGWARACRWWGRERVETKAGFDGSARPDYQGLLFQGVQRYAQPAEIVGAVIEFGTQSSLETRRALQGDSYLKTRPDLPRETVLALRAQLLEAFSPSASDWKQSVLAHAMQIQDQILQGVREWHE